MVRERQLIDWKARLEELVEEIQGELHRVNDLSAAGELEAICDRLSTGVDDLQSFTEEHLE